jgi:tetratricopeptide (TPR) repeat protein
MPRLGDRSAVWQTCRAMLGAAINIGCAALLAVVPSDPDLLLIAAFICVKLRRPRQAYEAVARLSATLIGHIARPDHTAGQMTKIAAAICAWGQRVEAKDVLRKAMAMAPQFAAPRLALACLLEEELRAAGPSASPGQWLERESLLRRSMAESPHLAAPRIALASCLQEKVRYLETQPVSERSNAPVDQVEAEDLLREAIVAESHLAAPRLALADFLLASQRYAEAEPVAAAAVQCCPSSPELRLALARIQFQLRRFEHAARTIEALLAIAPGHAWAWFEYGKVLRNSFHRLGHADRAFERAGDLAGNDDALLAGVAQQFLYDLNYEKAAKFYKRMLNLVPSMRENFVICRHYATSLREIGRTDEAADLIVTALESCRSAAKRAAGEGLELLKLEESLLLREAGRSEESDQALRSIKRIAVSSPCYERPEYLPRTPERLDRLAEIVGSRDVFVMLQGPSFATFAARLEEFADFEFAGVTLNSFPPVEQELGRIDRHADVLFFAQPGSVRSWHSELMAFLARPSANLVVTNRYALYGFSEFGVSESEFIARHDKRLLLVHSDGGPPLPSRPLHFENGSSLSLLIPLLLFARPRRIFLFGADGGLNPSFSKRPYFYYDDYDVEAEPQAFLNRSDMISFKGLPGRLEEHNRRLRIDAINADRVMGAALRSLEANLGIQIPPIFNVCPHSIHRVFPRIDIDAALAELARDRRSQGHRAA